MKKLPEIMPDYTIKNLNKEPFEAKCEELIGMFIVPKLGEKLSWAAYDKPQGNISEWGNMEVVSKAIVHEIEGVNINEQRYDAQKRNEFRDFQYVAQLTDTHCRYLAEIYNKDKIKHYFTFLDEDFAEEWGFGYDNCGKETTIKKVGLISFLDNNYHTNTDEEVFDVTGRYEIVINNKAFDTICVMNIRSYMGQHVAVMQYLDKNGKTILWRRFNRDNWKLDYYKQKWSDKLPTNEQITINGETYVHWYDCITDYIL